VNTRQRGEDSRDELYRKKVKNGGFNNLKNVQSKKDESGRKKEEGIWMIRKESGKNRFNPRPELRKGKRSWDNQEPHFSNEENRRARAGKKDRRKNGRKLNAGRPFSRGGY